MFLVEKFQSVKLRFLNAPNGEPVVIASDLVEALKGNKANTADIVKKYVRAKWWIDLPNPNGGRQVRCLFEPGAYQLAGNPMFQTDLAFEFQDWLYEKVLPKLRASGGYISPDATSEQLEALQGEIFQLKQFIDDQITEAKQAATKEAKAQYTIDNDSPLTDNPISFELYSSKRIKEAENLSKEAEKKAESAESRAKEAEQRARVMKYNKENALKTFERQKQQHSEVRNRLSQEVRELKVEIKTLKTKATLRDLPADEAIQTFLSELHKKLKLIKSSKEKTKVLNFLRAYKA